MTDHGAGPLKEFLSENDHDQRLRRASARRAFLSLQNAADGEDIYAESIYRAYIRWNRLDDEGDAQRRLAWFITIIDNVLKERIRSRRRQLSSQDIGMLDELPGCQDRSIGQTAHHLDDPTGDRVVHREALHQLLPAAMAALSDSCRAVMERHLDGMSDEQVADALGLATSTVRVTLKRARARLTAHLQPVVTSSRPEGGASA